MDKKALATLCKNYAAALFGAINKLLKNTAHAEEALQNTFNKIWLCRKSYDKDKGNPFTWMLNIARNEALDVLRSHYTRQTHITQPLNIGEHKADRNPFIHLDHVDVSKLLFFLKPADRNILELCYFRGFTCQQTANVLQIPCGTVKTSMRYSYKKLSALLSDPIEGKPFL